MYRRLVAGAALIAMLGLAACREKGEVYPRAVGEVHDLLAASTELPPVFGSDEPELEVDASEPARIAWILSKDEAEVMRFVATLEPEGDKATRVALDVAGATDGDHGNVQKRLDDHPKIKNFYLVAMAEHIDSTVEGRPFDITRTYGAMMAAAASNLGAIAGPKASGEAGDDTDN